MTKKIFIKSFGCQMNEYDSEIIRGILTQEGYVFIEDSRSADIVLLNTCSVRDNAVRKVFGYIHALRHSREGQPFLLGLLGCIATNLREELLNDRGLGIDFIAGPDSYKRLPELIRQAKTAGPAPYDVTLSELETYADVLPSRNPGVNAWVAVMRGCNNFCSFCVVPYTRGRERSRPVGNVIDEVQRLAADGYPQVTLLGQNVNSYRDGGRDFADLLTAVAGVEGVRRIRFMSPHPKDLPDRLIDVVAQNEKVCNHIHLPLQAGNDRVLDLMNRTYHQKDFLDLAAQIRARCPGVAITTDIIVGFPTETDAEFEDTVRVMQAVRFDSAFIFKYSPRKGTIAMTKYLDDVPETAKTTRIVRLNELQKDHSLERNREEIGRTKIVLIEKLSSQRSGDDAQGRTDENKLVILPNTGLTVGDFVTVRITGATPHVLKGKSG